LHLKHENKDIPYDTTLYKFVFFSIVTYEYSYSLHGIVKPGTYRIIGHLEYSIQGTLFFGKDRLRNTAVDVWL